MNKLMILAAGALTALAFAALPAGAAAEEVLAHCSAAPCEGVVESTGIGKLTDDSGLSLSCQKTTGSTNQPVATGTTGSGILTFDDCTDPFGGKCTSAGEPAGTIVTNTMVAHLITVAKGIPASVGSLFTGVNIDFVCVFAGTRNVTGNIIGTITNPECGKAVTHHTISFTQSSPGNQTHKTYTGNTFDLLSALNGGTGTTAAITGEGHVKYAVGKTATITC